MLTLIPWSRTGIRFAVRSGFHADPHTEEVVMKERNEEPREETREGEGECSRRSILLGSAALLAGGVAGRISSAYAAQEPTYAPAPPLPWKWTKLDPLEAGTRAYENYLKNKG
jgi:hypothetical protein